MKKIYLLVLASVLLLSACGSSVAGQADGEGIEAHDYWARAALKDGTGAAYMFIHNHSAEDDALVGASSDVAAAVEIHLSQMGADGTMQMIPQESIALPADGELELKPGSYHIMMIGLVKDLNVGDEINVTLHFEKHEDITLTIPVLDAAEMGGSGMDGHMNP
jgi:copper(I)-binding protein